ncbi:MAG: alpha/beta fold hydrolase [Planctomycetota bacterium]|nr:alpha/beta fold hydrolase [Planctomycetota bacterium]
MITGILGFGFLMLCATSCVLAAYCLVCARETRTPKRLSTGWALALSRESEPDRIDPECTRWTLDLPDGTTLPVWEARTGSDRSQPPEATLVFIHGWGNARTHSIERAQAVLESIGDRHPPPRWRLIFLDLRGHGDASDGPTTLGMRELEDLGVLLEELPKDAPRILIGHSLGAVLAIRTAARWPDEVDGVLALAPYRWVRTPIARTLGMRGLPAGRLADVIGRLCTSGRFLRLDTVDDARAMTQPLVVLSGTEDPICPTEEARAIARAAPRGEFEDVESVRHGDLHRQAPSALAGGLTRVLAGLDSNETGRTCPAGAP